MSAIPARVAGVGEVVLCTPASGDSLPDQTILAAAALAGVDRVFKIGGAQAIAAMALGTETVPRVDLVCGPGNAFVVAAKKQLYGEVGIDGLFGPTETLIVADGSASAELCAADFLAQAEHDVMARPVLVTVDETFADMVEREIEAQLARLDRRSIASAAIEGNAAFVIVSDVEEAVDVANAMAPEHLCLAVREPRRYVPMVRAAGGIFLGEHSAEVLGDYVAGPSHVMPTGGTARFASALSVRSFLRFTPVVDLNEQDVIDLGQDAARMARAEQLTGHAAAAEIRLRRLVGE
jgi:histidinol dehydrogenase